MLRQNLINENPRIDRKQSSSICDEELTGPARAAAIVKIIGLPDQGFTTRGLSDTVRQETARNWDKYVEPLIAAHWPEVRSLPFYAKFKIGAQMVYAPAPYTVVFLSKKRPLSVRALTTLCRWFRLPASWIVVGLKLLFPFYVHIAMKKESRRIILMAAFIALVDEAFDHHLEDVQPQERGELLHGILCGTVAPPTPSFSLVHAIRVALDQGTTQDESRELEEAMAGCVAWGKAEVRRFLGETDPEGLAHRGVGITTGIDGLAWTARAYISDPEKQWMYNVSLFIQMLDDWIDLEKDLSEGVCTPVAEGRWTLKTIAENFSSTTEGIASIAEQNGESYKPFLKISQRSYAYQVRDLLQNMLKYESETNT